MSNGPVGKLNLSLLAEQEFGDNPLRVFANRDLAGRAVGIRGWEWPSLKQVHGSQVVEAGGRRVEADGVWTDVPMRPLAVTSADCVLLLAVGAGRICCAHAGWRGTVAGVVENAVAAVGATHIFAGPAIGPCCFEVGTDVASEFAERFGSEAVADERHVDLWNAVEIAARSVGVEHVITARLCTSCNEHLFFSHRRDRGQTGRQALVARMLDD